MSTRKKAITIRLTETELSTLKQAANRNCMSLNQYLQYKLMEQCEIGPDIEFNHSRFLDKNLPLITRLIIDGYLHTKQIALQQVNQEDLSAINKEALAEFQKLGIEKKV